MQESNCAIRNLEGISMLADLAVNSLLTFSWKINLGFSLIVKNNSYLAKDLSMSDAAGKVRLVHIG
jgi:hypothetical protein